MRYDEDGQAARQVAGGEGTGDGDRHAVAVEADIVGADGGADGSSRIVVLTAGGPLAWSVVNGLAARLGRLTVIEERPETKGEIIRRRLRLVGPVATAGQVAFGVWQRIASRRAAGRLDEIRRQHGLDPSRPSDIPIHRVGSLNSEEARALLKSLDPDVVAVYGTRILSRKTLAAVEVPFINYHAGINPKYRGQHPAYWALAAGDDEHAGVTIHEVDAGVDTGGVIYQARVTFDPKDTISTYQTVQAATGIGLFARAIQDVLSGYYETMSVNLPSQNHLPPTIWRYWWNGLTMGVW